MTKDSIRRTILAQRDMMSPNVKEFLNNTIYENLLRLEDFQNADTVFLYASVRNEVETADIIEYCFKEGRKVALPCSYMSGGEPKMEFYYINSRTDLTPGYMKIPEPDRRKQHVKPALNMPDVIVIPGVAFDENLNRIGYGMGFYDSYLSSHGYISKNIKPVLIGLCYGFQTAYDIEADENDMKMSIIVSENGYIHG